MCGDVWTLLYVVDGIEPMEQLLMDGRHLFDCEPKLTALDCILTYYGARPSPVLYFFSASSLQPPAPSVQCRVFRRRGSGFNSEC